MTRAAALGSSLIRTEVRTLPDRLDAAGQKLSEEAERLLARPLKIRTIKGYSVELPALMAATSLDSLRPRLQRVLADPVLHEVDVLSATAPVPSCPRGFSRVEVVKRPGVMDPAAVSVQRALKAVGIPALHVRSYRAFCIEGLKDRAELHDLARRLLANVLIEEIRVHPTEPIVAAIELRPVEFERREIPILKASDEELMRISKAGMLALDLVEMQTIRAHFREQGREPTDVELETLAQTWSEHCKHKTLTSAIEIDGRHYDNLLKDTIFAATRRLARPYCLSVFKDNAGVVEFDDEYAVTFKVETHNHPSALEPYGGAGTGIGGVIRDTLGTGRCARPILSTDVFCVGPLHLGESDLPQGTLPPRRILQGVVAGVRDYGNQMGIPTTNGAVFVHADYRCNPLVFCGNVGLIPRNLIEKQARPGDRIFVLGGRTGRDGIHGATFSSEGLDSSSEQVASGAVQIGNAIEEKRLMDACLEARDLSLFTAITDCGAGGLSSAVGEMGADCGAEVELSKVPLKYHGLTPGEIWISEAQERMVIAVPPNHVRRLIEVCAIHQVEATDLGQFTDSGRLRITYQGVLVADLSMSFLHHGVPRSKRKARIPALAQVHEPLPKDLDCEALLLRLLETPDITSKEEIVRQYDHEVLSGSVIKPLVGPSMFGPSDACVVAPRLGSTRGIAVGCGMSPTLGRLDCYQMALHSIDEAVRNVIAVGGRFDRIVLLDNFAWPTVADEETLGTLVLAAEACRDAALCFGTPFISGKDSLNNQTRTEQGVIAIPPTLLISALTLVDDVTRCVTMDLKSARSALYVVGRTRQGLGGSRLLDQLELEGGQVPGVDLDSARRIHQTVADSIAKGLVLSCHDLSEGGLGVALAEMAIAGDVGATVTLKTVPRLPEVDDDAQLLFAESPSRYLLEVANDRVQEFEPLWMGLPCGLVGMTSDNRQLTVSGLSGQPMFSTSLTQLAMAFRKGLGL